MKKSILIITIGIFLFGNIGLFAQKVGKMPEASVGGKTSGNITKTELLNAGKLVLNLNNKNIVSFVLTIGSSNYSNSGFAFNNDVKSAINSVKKNTKIVFNKITVCEKTCSGVTTGLPTIVIKDLTLILIP